MRETIIINSRLAWRLARGDAAAKRSHGLQVLSIEHLAARLAGGFLQVIDSDTLKDAIAKALAADLGELNGIKELPGFPRAAATTLQKAWTAAIDLTTAPGTQDQAVARRLQAIARLEAEVLGHIPPSMQRPSELVAKALTRTQHARSLFGPISVHGHTEMEPVWRPLLKALAGVVDVRWVAGPRHVLPWVHRLGIPITVTPPENPKIECRSCASPRHEALEAMRWARSLIASGDASPQSIAIAAAFPEEWDDHFLALSDMSGLEVHFTHGRKVLMTAEGQLAAALAELLLRGFSQARMTRLIGLLRNHNPDFDLVPSDWWRDLPKDAPLLDIARWREVLGVASGPNVRNSEESLGVLRDLIETLALGLKRATDIGDAPFPGTDARHLAKSPHRGPAGSTGRNAAHTSPSRSSSARSQHYLGPGGFNSYTAPPSCLANRPYFPCLAPASDGRPAAGLAHCPERNARSSTCARGRQARFRDNYQDDIPADHLLTRPARSRGANQRPFAALSESLPGDSLPEIAHSAARLRLGGPPVRPPHRIPSPPRSAGGAFLLGRLA